MKAITLRVLQSKAVLLLPILLLSFCITTLAQDKKDREKTVNQKVTIHISKEVDGKITIIDTTFETSSAFNVSAWIDARNQYDDQQKMKKVQKEIRVTIPDISGIEPGNIPDTLIVNGDTIFMGMEGKEMKFMFHDIEELGDLDIDIPEVPEIPEFPRDCHSHPHFRFKGSPNWVPYMIPELGDWLPFGNIEEIEVVKKRNGKKIIIRFEQNDEPIILRKGRKSIYYFNGDEDAMEWQPQQGKKVIIRKHGDLKEVGEDTRVDRIKDGENEVIIIKKTITDDKED